jgi:hypothetical protein
MPWFSLETAPPIVLETKNLSREFNCSNQSQGDMAMSKKATKNTTRRGFVKKAAAGTAAIAVAGVSNAGST